MQGENGEERGSPLFMGEQNNSVQTEFSLRLRADLSPLQKMKDRKECWMTVSKLQILTDSSYTV